MFGYGEENLLIIPTVDVDYRQARKVLEKWLRKNQVCVCNLYRWTRWTYTPVPFWAVCCEFGGFHIHDDGEIIMINNKQAPEPPDPADYGC